MSIDARWWWRWLPFAAAFAAVSGLLIAADTSPLDIGRYALYATLAVALPGTLVYRSLRRNPHTFLEDVAIGIAVGLALELGAWALFSALNLRSVIWLWPLLVIVTFLAVPRLRRHWLVRDYPSRPSPGWSWSLAAIIVFFACYLYGVYFSVNTVLPDSESAVQFLDLPYQLSLAGEAKHNFPLNLPQVAGEPLHYHWFSFVHLAMTSMVGFIDLPVVTMRLMIPAICSLTAVLTAVVGWRLSGKRWVGIVAAALFFVIGDFDFASAPWPPFGTQVTFVIWPSLSMTFSWALLVALIGVVGNILRSTDDDGVPRIGPGAYVLVGLLAVASSATKASSLPVLAAGLAVACAAMLIAKRRIPWPVVALGSIVALAQLFATAAVFAFESYGISITPFSHLTAPAGLAQGRKEQAVIIGLGLAYYLLHLQLRGFGILSLLWLQKGRLQAVQWFLLGGAIAGPALHMTFSGYASTWFGRAGFPFAVLLSAWGYVLVFERARLSLRGKALLGVGALISAIVLIAVTWKYGVTAYPTQEIYSPYVPALKLAAVLAVIGLIAGIFWWLAGKKFTALRGRGAVVLLTGILIAGAPGFLMDIKMSWGVPGGPYQEKVRIPASYVDAARWVRSHSEPDDVLATNAHCTPLELTPAECVGTRSFWLSAYSERSVLIEGWAFATRAQASKKAEFWDQALFNLNEDAFSAPAASSLAELRDQHGVRYLVSVRADGKESDQLGTLAKLVYENSSVAVYELS